MSGLSSRAVCGELRFRRGLHPDPDAAVKVDAADQPAEIVEMDPAVLERDNSDLAQLARDAAHMQSAQTRQPRPRMATGALMAPLVARPNKPLSGRPFRQALSYALGRIVLATTKIAPPDTRHHAWQRQSDCMREILVLGASWCPRAMKFCDEEIATAFQPARWRCRVGDLPRRRPVDPENDRPMQSVAGPLTLHSS